MVGFLVLHVLPVLAQWSWTVHGTHAAVPVGKVPAGQVVAVYAQLEAPTVL